MEKTVVVQKWEESERGWGVRPDGYSLHLTEQARQEFIYEYWLGMPDKAPDEYSRPSPSPVYAAEVDQATYDQVLASKNGIRVYSSSYPEAGGTVG